MLPEMKGGPMHGGWEWEEVGGKNSRINWYHRRWPERAAVSPTYPLLIPVHIFQA